MKILNLSSSSEPPPPKKKKPRKPSRKDKPRDLGSPEQQAYDSLLEDDSLLTSDSEVVEINTRGKETKDEETHLEEIESGLGITSSEMKALWETQVKNNSKVLGALSIRTLAMLDAAKRVDALIHVGGLDSSAALLDEKFVTSVVKSTELSIFRYVLGVMLDPISANQAERVFEKLLDYSGTPDKTSPVDALKKALGDIESEIDFNDKPYGVVVNRTDS